MFSATRRTPARTSVRASSLTVRIVPKRNTDSGMMLFVVPAVIWAIVTTAGSNTSTRRVTIACSARTISAATAIGSRAVWGADAWPPRPRTVMRIDVGGGHQRARLAGGPRRVG